LEARPQRAPTIAAAARDRRSHPIPTRPCRVVVEAGDDVRNVHRLSTLIQQVTAENALALGIGVNFLIHDADHGIGGCGDQSCLDVHVNVFDVLQIQIRKVDAVRGDLFGQQNVGDFIEAALVVDGIACAVDQSGVDSDECGTVSSFVTSPMTTAPSAESTAFMEIIRTCGRRRFPSPTHRRP